MIIVNIKQDQKKSSCVAIMRNVTCLLFLQAAENAMSYTAHVSLQTKHKCQTIILQLPSVSKVLKGEEANWL